MAGPDPDGEFDAATTRTEIQDTMFMGLPEDKTLRPTFYFPTDDTFAEASLSGAPWDWDASPLENDDDREPVQVPCAVEVAGTGVDFTSIGTFNPQRAVLTFCDEDYKKVKGFHQMTMSGAVYLYSKLIDVNSIFDFSVYRVEVIARDRP